MIEFFAEACVIAVADEMVTATWTVGDPPRIQAIMHMPTRRWQTFITSAYERLGMTPQ